MQVTARAFGGAVAAFGVARLIWDLGAIRSLYSSSGYVPPQPLVAFSIFLIAVGLAIGVFL